MDALAYHVYLGAGNTDSVMNTSRALSVPFAQLHQRFVQSKFPSIPANVEVWVTEFNMGEALAGNPQQHAETWMHGLYVAAMLHIFLENPKITMILDHNLTNQLEFAAISPYDMHITANGTMMRLFGEMSKGMKSATRLTFPSLSQQQYGAQMFPKMIGWKFTNSGAANGIIVNLSSDTLQCDISSLFSGPVTVQQYWSDPLEKIVTPTDLQKSTTVSSQFISVRPYAVVQLSQQLVTAARTVESLPNGFMLEQNYPNPFNPTTTIHYTIDQSGPVSLVVYDNIGREVIRLIDEVQNAGSYTKRFDALSFASGVYLLELRRGSNARFKKMILMK